MATVDSSDPPPLNGQPNTAGPQALTIPHTSSHASRTQAPTLPPPRMYQHTSSHASAHTLPQTSRAHERPTPPHSRHVLAVPTHSNMDAAVLNSPRRTAPPFARSPQTNGMSPINPVSNTTRQPQGFDPPPTSTAMGIESNLELGLTEGLVISDNTEFAHSQENRRSPSTAMWSKGNSTRCITGA